MALFYSTELVAPEELYRTISAELDDLRRLMKSAYPELLSIKPTLVGRPEYLTLYLVEDSMPSFLNGRYEEWVEMNEKFGYEVIDSYYKDYTTVKYLWALLKTDKRINPYRIGREYEKLAGISSSVPHESAADKPNIYFGLVRGKPFFLIRQAWGGCPNGCMNSHYYLFTRGSEGYALEREWEPQLNDDPPRWLLDAREAVLANRDLDSLVDIPYWLKHLNRH